MLKQRVITALILLAILLPALFYPTGIPFAVVVLVLMAAGAWEWGRLNGFGTAGAIGIGAICTAMCLGAWAAGWLERPLSALWIVAGAAWVLGGGRCCVPAWLAGRALLRLCAWSVECLPCGWPGLPWCRRA